MTTDPLRIALSTSSVYPLGTAAGFELAKRVGYDGVAAMVGRDDVSADINSVRALMEAHEIPIFSVHAPCLLVTQRVWGTEHWGKLHKAAEMAMTVGADTVVVHPPFRWQREYARGFVKGIAKLEDEYPITFAVENMYPWRTGNRVFQAYAPGWDPTDFNYKNITIDFSHASVAKVNSIDLLKVLGDRVAHIHLADGTGSALDEHLVPGRGDQDCATLLNYLANNGFKGHIAVEISTRKAPNNAAREAVLREALEFARKHARAAVAPVEPESVDSSGA